MVDFRTQNLTKKGKSALEVVLTESKKKMSNISTKLLKKRKLFKLLKNSDFRKMENTFPFQP
jgi:hypothetical protein